MPVKWRAKPTQADYIKAMHDLGVAIVPQRLYRWRLEWFADEIVHSREHRYYPTFHEMMKEWEEKARVGVLGLLRYFPDGTLYYEQWEKA